MARSRIIWQLYPSYLLIIVLSVLILAWYALDSQRRMFHDKTAADLHARAVLIENQVSNLLAAGDTTSVDPLCKRLGSGSSTRITIILPNGRVIGDSREDPTVMDNHATRPEISEALFSGRGVSTRYSNTLQNDLMYVALRSPAPDKGTATMVVRTSIEVSFINESLHAVRGNLLFAGLVVVLLAAIFSWFVSRRISRPLESLRQGARRFAEGDLDRRLPVGNSEEIGGLAEDMNRMAAQLDQRIRTITRQRSEQEAILSSLVEGVLAVDTDQKIISLNRTAARMLGIDPITAPGRTVQEIIRNSDLHQFVSRSLSASKPIEDEIMLLGDEERLLRATGAVLSDSDGESIGGLIVLHDQTRLKRLENVRREFVANVSHELKSPITSIKGFVETLRDGALDNREDTHRFLDIILRQARRLNAIVDDLLTISRYEKESKEAPLALEQGEIREVIHAAVEACEVSARAGQIKIETECERSLKARINPLQLERAIINLIDNGIKFSYPGSTVRVESSRDETEIRITVFDNGPGIDKSHLPRLFERFYRVDKARSREMGGTGLGLAIVKHVALAHGGRVSVESTPGKGSRFSIHLPI